MVSFLHIDAGVLSQHFVDAAVFELGRFGLWRKIALVNRDRRAQVLTGVGHGSQSVFPASFLQVCCAIE